MQNHIQQNTTKHTINMAFAFSPSIGTIVGSHKQAAHQICVLPHSCALFDLRGTQSVLCMLDLWAYSYPNYFIFSCIKRVKMQVEEVSLLGRAASNNAEYQVVRKSDINLSRELQQRMLLQLAAHKKFKGKLKVLKCMWFCDFLHNLDTLNSAQMEHLS